VAPFYCSELLFLGKLTQISPLFLRLYNKKGRLGMQSTKQENKAANISFHCTVVFLLNYSSLQGAEKEKTPGPANRHTPEKA